MESDCNLRKLTGNGGRNRDDEGEEEDGRRKREGKELQDETISISISDHCQVAPRQAQARSPDHSPQGYRSLHRSLGPTKGEAYRDNDRISVTDPLLANAIWESGLNKLFSDIKIRGRVAVGLNPNLRFYRYNVGQRFGRHIDESVDLGEGKRTHYTLLIYLSGGSKSKAKNDSSNHSNSPSELLVGGETVFYNSRNGIVAEVAPAEGMALLHIHGDKCMLHEARNVTKGVKYVFRSDIAFA
ncbi:uncharacterized protein LOC115732384 isoform X5 [Rhodamnia argentea]|uniref:Uncharacterized protein LOC115732384 isoform X5 n=1 Tax=Rhodamnia argentea TaxID=178133 RepID=A0ABM3GSQ0_9MYRT|nr:uncharacterized protein LOC115732384 isoform X5 [Rhodamnia argentea]